jgi:hypothetical protein
LHFFIFVVFYKKREKMSKKKIALLSRYEKGERSRREIPYNHWGVKRDVLFKKDLDAIFQEHVLLREIKSLEMFHSIQLRYRINLITGEKIEFVFSFLKRTSNDMFVEKTNSRSLNIIINGDLVNYNDLYKKIKKEIDQRLFGYGTEWYAFEVINKHIQKTKSADTLIKGVRKGTMQEDQFLHSDFIIQWENGESFGIDIKTSKKYFELALRKREYKFTQYGNPVLTSLKELTNNPSKFIKKIEHVGKNFFEHK